MTRWPIPHPMQRALALAREAAREAEVPVGAVIMRGGECIAEGQNSSRTDHDPTAHAEIMALRAAARRLRQDRLTDCELWVTLEPCAMCAGAISHARIGKLYYAADDPKGGGVEHGARIFEHDQCLHKPEVYSGMGASQSAALLQEFFQSLRR